MKNKSSLILDPQFFFPDIAVVNKFQKCNQHFLSKCKHRWVYIQIDVRLYKYNIYIFYWYIEVVVFYISLLHVISFYFSVYLAGLTVSKAHIDLLHSL